MTWVPGLVKGAKPDFTSRYTYWRNCSLQACGLLGLIYIVIDVLKMAARIMTVRQDVQQMQEPMRDQLVYFVYTSLGAEVAAEVGFCLGVLLLCVAWWNKGNFIKSKSESRTAWLVLVMSPFIPFVVVPFGSSVRTDIIQRDTCATTLGAVLQNQMAKTSFSDAADTAGLPELMPLALSAPIQPGQPGYDQWNGTIWCYHNAQNWMELIFGTAWLQLSANGGTDEDGYIMSSDVGEKPGIFPIMLEQMATRLGQPIDPKFTYCNKTVGGGTAGADAKEPPSLLQVTDADGLSHFQALEGSAAEVLGSELKNQGGQAVSVAVGAEGQVQFHDAPVGGGAGRLMRRSEPQEAVSTLELSQKTHHHGQSRYRHRESAEVVARKEGRHQHTHPRMDIDVLSALQMEIPKRPTKKQVADSMTVASAQKVGTSMVCEMYQNLLRLLQLARVSDQMAVQLVGLFSTFLCFRALFVSMFSIVDGLTKGVVNVKKVIHKSSVPGYLLYAAVIGSLPPIFFSLACLNQLVANRLFAGVVTFIVLWRVIDLWRADIMTDTGKPQRMLREFNRATSWMYYMQLVAMGFAICYILQLVWSLRGQSSVVAKVQNLDFSALASPSLLVSMSMKYVLMQVVTCVVTTDIVLQATFDAADDDIQLSGESEQDILQAWCKLNDIPIVPKPALKPPSRRSEILASSSQDPTLARPSASSAAPPVAEEPEGEKEQEFKKKTKRTEG